jgi:hypothetical protein
MQQIKHAVDLFLLKAGLQEQLNKREQLALWNKIAGKQIIRHSRPLTIKKNKLFVEVTDSTWLFHLTMLKPRIIEDFNRAAGFKAISDIKFFNADFHSRLAREREETNALINNEQLCNEDENAGLEPGEENDIDNAVLLSPEHFQPRLRSLLRKSFLYQKRQQIK